MNNQPDYGLEFLLDFHGRIHYFERGYWLKFEIKRVDKTEECPHGLSYSFTLHAPNGVRLVGFDNAHRVGGKSTGYKKRSKAHDHWHKIGKTTARPYKYKNAETLLDDFFKAVEQVLSERGIGPSVVQVKETR